MSISAQEMIDSHTESGIVYARWREEINHIYDVLKHERDNPFEGATSVRVRLSLQSHRDSSDRIRKVMIHLEQGLKYEGYSVEFEYGNASPFDETTNIPTHIVVSWA